MFTGVSHTPVVYNGKRYPAWADAMGWLMVAAAVIWIPILMIVETVKHFGTFQVGIILILLLCVCWRVAFCWFARFVLKTIE